LIAAPLPYCLVTSHSSCEMIFSYNPARYETVSCV
jgi:hypothetical protein